MQALSPAKTRTLEFGIYRDGDNNLDESQGVTLGQALKTSAADSRIEYTVQDTTSLGGKKLRTDSFTLADGHIGQASIDAPHDMASEQNLAQFVARTLDNAQKAGAKETWIDLVDHGAGDGGGLEADSAKQIMAMPQMAQAIADGIKLHAREHPEDAGRKIDGVVANQCLIANYIKYKPYHCCTHFIRCPRLSSLTRLDRIGVSTVLMLLNLQSDSRE